MCFNLTPSGLDVLLESGSDEALRLLHKYRKILSILLSQKIMVFLELSLTQEHCFDSKASIAELHTHHLQLHSNLSQYSRLYFYDHLDYSIT